MVVIGGYESGAETFSPVFLEQNITSPIQVRNSVRNIERNAAAAGIDAAVHLANAGVDVTVLTSTPFWSVRTLDPSTELAPFTAGRLQAAMNGPHPPTLVPSCRVVRVDRDEDGGYVIIADKNRAATDAEVLCLPVRRPAAGFGVFLQTSTIVAVEAIEPGGAAEQGAITTPMNALPLPRTVYLYGAQEDFTKQFALCLSRWAQGRRCGARPRRSTDRGARATRVGRGDGSRRGTSCQGGGGL